MANKFSNFANKLYKASEVVKGLGGWLIFCGMFKSVH